jgi:hypothetical protein
MKTTISDDAQISSTITAIYYYNIGVMIEYWKQHITATSLDIAPGVKKEELA